MIPIDHEAGNFLHVPDQHDDDDLEVYIFIIIITNFSSCFFQADFQYNTNAYTYIHNNSLHIFLTQMGIVSKFFQLLSINKLFVVI